MKKTFIAVLGAALLTSGAVADPENRRYSHESGTTSDAAVELVDRYYAHMKRGMARSQLGAYWTESNLQYLDELTVEIAQKTGKDLALESQQVMDLAHMEARCEEIAPADSRLTNSHPMNVKIGYTVKNRCEVWRGTTSLTITLRFAEDVNGEEHWLIDQIEDESNGMF